MQINILSYNIHGLPALFNSKQEQNTKTIINKSIDYEIILYQENWVYSKEFFETTLRKHNIYISSTSKRIPFLTKILNPNGAGLTMAIKKDYTTLHYEEVIFDHCSGYFNKQNDCLASKGLQKLTLLFKEAGEIDIYNTHLDAGQSKADINARKNQIKTISRHIKKSGNTNPIIFAGDFNMNLYDADSILYHFYKDFNFTTHYRQPKEGIIDYIFVRNGESIKLKIIKYQLNKAFYKLSDHPAITATIAIEFEK